MGHTIPSKRYVIYAKLNDLMRFANSVREPYRSRFASLIRSVYPSISSIVYTNSLDDDEMIVYSMLLGMSRKLEADGRLRIEDKERILRCLAILMTREGE